MERARSRHKAIIILTYLLPAHKIRASTNHGRYLFHNRVLRVAVGGVDLALELVRSPSRSPLIANPGTIPASRPGGTAARRSSTTGPGAKCGDMAAAELAPVGEDRRQDLTQLGRPEPQKPVPGPPCKGLRYPLGQRRFTGTTIPSGIHPN